MLRVVENAAWFAAFAFIIAFVAGMALSASPHKSSIDKYEQPAKTEQWQNNNSRAVPEQNASKCDNCSDNKTHWYDHITDWLIALFTFFLVIANIALYKSAEKSANSAKLAAYAARDAVEHSDRNVATQLRAYIFLDSFTTTRVVNLVNGTPTVMGYQFSGRWKNVGQTPSLATSAFMSVCLRDRTETGTVVFKVDIPKKQDAINIGSGLPVATGVIGVSISDILAIMGDKRTKELFVATGVNYSDVFGETHAETIASEVEVVNDPNIIDFNGELFRYRAITDYAIEKH